MEMVKVTSSTSTTTADSVDDARTENTDNLDNTDTVAVVGSTVVAGISDGRSLDIDDNVVDNTDNSAGGDGDESDGDCAGNERVYLEAMPPDGQQFYLRLGDTPRRRSALRLSRIIARQQLLRRLEQGRNGPVDLTGDTSVRFRVLV